MGKQMKVQWAGQSDPFKLLEGKVVKSARLLDDNNPHTFNEGIYFEIANGPDIAISHEQNCCEGFTVVDDGGDLKEQLASLEDQIVVEAELATNEEIDKGCDDVEQWSFYKIRTMTTSITFRFMGTSNGYYSMTPDIFVAEENDA